MNFSSSSTWRDIAFLELSRIAQKVVAECSCILLIGRTSDAEHSVTFLD